LTKNGIAFNADRMRVKGSAYLRRGFQAEGKISFVSVSVGGQLHWWDVQNPEMVTLDLRSTTVKTLWDEKQSWPPKNNILLQGFAYEELFHRAPANAEDR